MKELNQIKEEPISWEEMANVLGISVEKLKKIAFEDGLIDEKGRPTQYALDEGLLVIE